MTDHRRNETGQPDAAPSGNVPQMTKPARTASDWLRFIPPVAALGSAFILQIVAVADLLGGVLADRFNNNWAYLPAVLFGLAVAASIEGGAAYLMDLYDKHLLARDGTLWLRVLMVAYVAGSAAAIHWWADFRGLPTIMSWLLAAMSASALFLWSRGSRWKNREVMRASGQIDPALPRLPMAAKIMHPWRSLVTMWLIAWEPAPTTTAARARYEAWKARRDGRTDIVDLEVQQAVFLAEGRSAVRRIEVERELSAVRDRVYAELEQVRAEVSGALSAERAAAAAELSAVQAEAEKIRAAAALYADSTRAEADGQAAAVRADADRTAAESVRRRDEAYSEADSVLAAARVKAGRLTARSADSEAYSPRPARTAPSNGVRRTAAAAKPAPKTEVSVEQLADSLDARFPDTVPGRPTAIEHLKKVYGSCSNDRARDAVRLLSARRESAVHPDSSGDGSDDKEHSPGRANGAVRDELYAGVS